MTIPDQRTPPGLCLLWPRGLLGRYPEADLPAGYAMRPYAPRDEQDGRNLRRLLEADCQALSEADWRAYRSRLLVDGLFVIVETATETLAAAAGAVHYPSPGWFHFPFGGELAYLVVHPDHRGRGLGRAASALVVRRFLTAGYECIRVSVPGCQLAAIRLYLKLGFVPFLHAADSNARWERVCGELHWEFSPEQWPQTLP